MCFRDTPVSLTFSKEQKAGSESSSCSPSPQAQGVGGDWKEDGGGGVRLVGAVRSQQGERWEVPRTLQGAGNLHAAHPVPRERNKGAPVKMENKRERALNNVFFT